MQFFHVFLIVHNVLFSRRLRVAHAVDPLASSAWHFFHVVGASISTYFPAFRKDNFSVDGACYLVLSLSDFDFPLVVMLLVFLSAPGNLHISSKVV